MQNHLRAAVLLLKKTFAVLWSLKSQHLDESVNQNTIISRDQEHLLSRLQFQAMAIVGPAWGHPYCLRPMSTHTKIPSKFSSVAEAKACFHTQTYMHGPFRDIKQLPEQPDWPQRYKSAVDLFLESSPPLSPEDQNRLDLIEIHRLMSPFSPKPSRPGFSIDTVDEMQWDRHTATFSKILDLARKVIHDQNLIASQSFTLDFGILGPLGALAHRCRDPSLRRESIRLLRTYDRQEGMWHSSLAAKIAARLVEIEEAGIPRVRSCDIANWERISGLKIRHDLNTEEVTIGYLQQESATDHTRIYVEEKIDF